MIVSSSSSSFFHTNPINSNPLHVTADTLMIRHGIFIDNVIKLCIVEHGGFICVCGGGGLGGGGRERERERE